MRRLEDIGFYTLSDARAMNSSEHSPLWRCELILTDRCNFMCPYCRGLRKDLCGTLAFEDAERTVRLWLSEGLKNIRFSGGEPTLYGRLFDLVDMVREGGVERIAVSTNGSLDLSYYLRSIESGVNDLSISLDGCCSEVGDKMAGIRGVWGKVVDNIRALSSRTYVTVGMVFTEDNVGECVEAVQFAASLGVSDIRVIPSAQYNEALRRLSDLPDEFLNRFPILRYRVNNIRVGRHVRGIPVGCTDKCRLALDDMAVAGRYHFPCIIYMREQGDPIGEIGPNVRADRAKWMEQHEPWTDPICRKNCLDVCVDYNRRANSPAAAERKE